MRRDAFLNQFVDASTGQPLQREQIEIVPQGHSGVYIESSMAWIEDSLIAGNSLTGISVVRSGFLNLSGSDITENGGGHDEQVMVEDLHDIRNNTHLNFSVRGGLMEGPYENNFVSRINSNRGVVYKGGLARTVPHSIEEPLTIANLLRW
jgi:hypothetical protein